MLKRLENVAAAGVGMVKGNEGYFCNEAGYGVDQGKRKHHESDATTYTDH